jgi:V/A-type H+/Na+-transporting ATPase subunit D
MAKIKLTKGELKKQRDALRQYQRYLPTLQLKKQQLQMEILKLLSLLDQARAQEEAKRSACLAWAGLLATAGIEAGFWLKPSAEITASRNIAGVEVMLLERLEFAPAEYDLFIMPLWLDRGLELLREEKSLRMQMRLLERAVETLRHELRITTQRVNLFEKVKIPEAEEAIRVIKISIGDQMANAVGRSKAAKRKIEALNEAPV